MKDICAIICEYNPFHNGHAYQIRKIRECLGDVTVLSVMSGNTVQRGEFALFDKYVRAKAAVICGADIAAELPFPFSCASAEIFASAGVRIAAKLGANYLSFGVEDADEKNLFECARVLLTPEFEAELRKTVSENPELPFALSRSFAAERLGVSVPDKPNDILALEYVKAIISNGYKISILPVRRIGAEYKDTSENEFMSAAGIRRAAENNAFPCVPMEVLPLYENSVRADIKNAEKAVLSFFRFAKPSELVDIADMNPDLAARMCACAQKSTDIDGFFRMCATKKYTNARIRRAAIYAMTGISAQSLRRMPEYTNLLAANPAGRELLSAMREAPDKSFRVITKPADYRNCPPGVAGQYELGISADKLFTLSQNPPSPSDRYMKNSPYLL